MTASAQFTAMLARLDTAVQGQPIGKMPALLMKDILIIIMAVSALLLLLLVWARYLRHFRPKKRRTGGHKVFRESSSSHDESEEDDAPVEVRRRYKYRYRRRDHRSRNPTLAETGGLPPVRTGEPTKPT
jgi:hypothetical protein